MIKPATTPALDNISAAIFNQVCRAMQDAEERWGPGEEHYPSLMDAIIAECEARKTNCYLQHARNQGVVVVGAPNVHRDAQRAYDIMMAHDHDSFGPRDAVRALPDYDHMSPEYRGKVNDKLDKLIATGD